ncbi:MAG: hypothetical protein RIS29_1269 [Bacteroidota bacterium]|jgi:hypothetical protein
MYTFSSQKRSFTKNFILFQKGFGERQDVFGLKISAKILHFLPHCNVEIAIMPKYFDIRSKFAIKLSFFGGLLMQIDVK